jgi:hypothetical protein
MTSSFVRSRALVLRLLGLVYLVAFVSLGVQITGLVGERGLLPAVEFLGELRRYYGAGAWWSWPTLVWLSPTDTGLRVLCWGGAAVSVLLMFGIAPAAAAAVLWALYLSLTIAGQEFLQFQWDGLLLETGLLAVLYAPLASRLRARLDPEPPAMVRWALWGLAFKLTFLSGITKILSGDSTWANWTALAYHYETQPLPAWTSWFAHQLPRWIQSASVGGMFVVEVGVPWLILLPARARGVRVLACVLMILLQAAIGATGNYGFFNLLTIVLYLALLDDRTIERFLPWRAARGDRPFLQHPGEPVLWRAGVTVVALGITVLSLLALIREIDATRGRSGPFGWSEPLLARVAPIHSINGYGLFRVMTTERPEIVMEVSQDGRTWKEHEFRWKPGEVGQRPRFVEPHMPRLDWQMWFAALDPRSTQSWLARLIERRLAGEPAVMKLLGPNPLDGRARWVRLAYYRYRFTSRAQRARTGAWWRREFVSYLTDAIGPAPQ